MASEPSQTVKSPQKGEQCRFPADSLQSVESRRGQEQVCDREGQIWKLPRGGEDRHGVLPLGIHLHPDGQAHLQPRS